MLHRQPTIDEMRAAMEATELPPKDGFARMVSWGLIDSEGQLTKLFGGEAEPEPGSQPPSRIAVGNSNGQS